MSATTCIIVAGWLYCICQEPYEPAYNTLVDLINSLDEDCLQEQCEESEEHELVDDRNATCSVQHPFGAYFRQRLDSLIIIDQGSTENKYHKPEYFEYFDMLMKNWFPMAPFWSALMLGKHCDCYIMFKLKCILWWHRVVDLQATFNDIMTRNGMMGVMYVCTVIQRIHLLNVWFSSFIEICAKLQEQLKHGTTY